MAEPEQWPRAKEKNSTHCAQGEPATQACLLSCLLLLGGFAPPLEYIKTLPVRWAQW